jgi:hypothetical protein
VDERRRPSLRRCARAAFEYAVYEQADKNANTHFNFETYDTYSWYLNLGPLSNINAKYLHGSIPYWNAIVEHPDYDEFWKKEAWVTQIKGAFVPNLNVAGFWDQEDPWGPWEIYRRSEQSDPNRYNFIFAGPWFHGQWHNLKAESIGQISFGGHDTATEFREKIEAPWFRYWLHGKGEKFPWKASTFQTGSNSWHTYQAWAPASTATKLYLHRDGLLSFGRAAGRQHAQHRRSGVGGSASDFSLLHPAGDGGAEGRRQFVGEPSGVATWASRPLDRTLPSPATGREPGRDGNRQRFFLQLIDPSENARRTPGKKTRPAAGQPRPQRLTADGDGGLARPLQQGDDTPSCSSPSADRSCDPLPIMCS